MARLPSISRFVAFGGLAHREADDRVNPAGSSTSVVPVRSFRSHMRHRWTGK
jgi:hypothetical protein